MRYEARLDQMGLARAGRTNQQDDGLLHDHIPGSASVTTGSGASRSQVSTIRLKWLLTPRASRRWRWLALSRTGPGGRPGFWERGSRRGVSFEGAGGGVGPGTGWGISARALVARRCRCGSSNQAALKERDVLVEAEGTHGLIFGHGDTKGRGVSGPPTPGSRIPPSMVSVDHRNLALRRNERNALVVPLHERVDHACVQYICTCPVRTRIVCPAR